PAKWPQAIDLPSHRRLISVHDLSSLAPPAEHYYYRHSSFGGIAHGCTQTRPRGGFCFSDSWAAHQHQETPMSTHRAAQTANNGLLEHYVKKI
ncbi:hypothetical protein, partial [Salmonella enterica]|uniref:hypothetical protein n=1 Tax=Salmonella enterica TaxID=28901 RepID=UPI0022B6C439